MEYKDVLELILDADDVTVGGGSASAMSGAVACGLIGMVCGLSVKKDFGYSPEKQLEYKKSDYLAYLLNIGFFIFLASIKYIWEYFI